VQDANFLKHDILKGIVSCDWEGLMMLSVDRYNILDIAGKYLFNILKSASLAGEQSATASVAKS
jgi:hypothetical protein